MNVRNLRRLVPFILALWFVQGGASLTLSPSATVSLITEDPGREVYLAFGHSAVRVHDPVIGIDLLYNFGEIDPRYLTDPSFVPRFVAGDLRYSLGVSRFRDATEVDKQWEDRNWYEQVLNLTPDQVNRVFAELEWNALEENRAYQYDFVADNCATRIPALFAKVLGAGTVRWGNRAQPTSAQVLIGKSLENRPLWKFWSFLAIGAVTYRTATDEQIVFMPEELQRATRDATITVDGTEKPFVVAEHQVLEGAVRGTYDEPGTSPVPWLWVLLGLVAASSVTAWLGWWKPWMRAVGRIGDGIFFGLVGVGGSILVFLTFFSVHTATHENFTLVWLTPLAFVAAWVAIQKQAKPWHSFVWIGILVLNLVPLVLGPWGPQPLIPEHWPLLGLAIVRATFRLMPPKEITHVVRR